MKIGFTGSRWGMSNQQKYTLEDLLRAIKPEEFHHGDCVGADAEAHRIALMLNIPVIIHPPGNPTNRAFCDGGTVLPTAPYNTRNHGIVDDTDILIAAPQSEEQVIRSGTWATIRYATKINRRVEII